MSEFRQRNASVFTLIIIYENVACYKEWSFVDKGTQNYLHVIIKRFKLKDRIVGVKWTTKCETRGSPNCVFLLRDCTVLYTGAKVKNLKLSQV